MYRRLNIFGLCNADLRWKRPENSAIISLKYRINGGGVGIIGGLEMVRHNNNHGVGIIGGGAAWRNRKQPFS